jgi:hypothetical protein
MVDGQIGAVFIWWILVRGTHCGRLDRKPDTLSVYYELFISNTIDRRVGIG